jgi:hypothetical protein
MPWFCPEEINRKHALLLNVTAIIGELLGMLPYKNTPQNL